MMPSGAGGHLRAWALAALSCLLVRVAAVQGAPGGLDPSFGQGGTVTTNFDWGSTESRARAVLRQSDGKLVIAGTGWKGIPCLSLIRFATDGSLDSSFGDEGRVLTVLGSPLFTSFTEGIYGLVQQSDGKLVAAGRVATELENQTALVRYQLDGSLDTTFGVDGVVRVAFSGVDQVSALALQNDGKLVVAGYRGYGEGDGDMLVARFDSDGSIDTEFGDGGTVAVGLAPEGFARAVAIQSDGKLVVAGGDIAGYDPYTGVNDYRIVLARYLADGTPDAGFGSAGVVMTNPSILEDHVGGLLQQDDGRLVVVGSMERGIYNDLMVLRYDESGALDPGFGSGGLVTLQLGNTSVGAAGVVQRHDGRLVVAANAAGAVNWDVALIQYDEGGTLDPGFGSGGVASADLGPTGGAVWAVLRQADAKLVIAGDGGGGMALARFEAGGTLDVAFGIGGVASASASGSVDRPAAFVTQGDGKLVAVGTTQTWDFPAFALARYDADGRLDPTFGTGGKVITPVGNGYVAAAGVVQQVGGQLVVAGTVTVDSTTRIGLARYTSDGVLDPAFGDGGVLITTLGPGNEGAGALLQQSDGKLLLVGGSGGETVLVRYQADGGFDLGFGNGGTVRMSDLGLGPITQQADGKLVAGGGGSIDLFAMARFNVDGTFDPTFSGDGKTFVGGLEFWDEPFFADVLQQTDGKLVGAGDHFLMRFSAGGSLDNAFGVRGVAAGPIRVRAAGQLPDGTLVGGGHAILPEHVVRFALTHYDVNGVVDSSFGNGGVAQAMSDSVDSHIVDLQARSDGRIVAFGESDSDFAFARFFGQSTSTTSTSSTVTTSTTTSSSSSSSVTTTVATTSSTTTTLGCLDVDSDGVCDPSDACVNVGRVRDATRARLTARHLLPPGGDDALAMSGMITLLASIDPVITGIRVLYGDQAGDIVDVLIPPGAYDATTRTGWTVQGGGYRYVNGDGTLDLVKVVLRANVSVPGQYKVKVKGRNGTYAGRASDLPVHAVIVFGPPFTGGGNCGEWRFVALPPARPSCMASATGDVLKCR